MGGISRSRKLPFSDIFIGYRNVSLSLGPICILINCAVGCRNLKNAKTCVEKLASYARNHGNTNSPIEKLQIHNIVYTDSIVLSFFPREVLDEILNLIESVSEDFPSYFFMLLMCKQSRDTMKKQQPILGHLGAPKGIKSDVFLFKNH